MKQQSIVSEELGGLLYVIGAFGKRQMMDGVSIIITIITTAIAVNRLERQHANSPGFCVCCHGRCVLFIQPPTARFLRVRRKR